MIDDSPTPLSVNRYAVISLIAAILTAISFCIAVAPIPFTGYVCYPAAAVLGLFAFGMGLASLAQLRSRHENGREYALIGVWVGGLTSLASSCAITAAILLLPRIIELIRQYIR